MKDIAIKEGIRLKCPTCGNIWVYGGKNKYFATCSHCRGAVNVRKYRVLQEIVK